MTPSSAGTSTSWVESIEKVIQSALDSLFLHEDALAQLAPPTNDPQRVWADSLARLDETVANWQAILDSLGEQVRTTQDELATLDADLHRSLGAFATARKHLQGETGEAVDAPSA